MSATVLTNATLATIDPSKGPYGLVPNGAVVINNGLIAWTGTQSDLPASFAALPERDLEGRLLTPGLIDCHTHIIHGGNRAREFELRLKGASYEEVARAGGGIVSTVEATRRMSVDELVADARPRVDTMIAEGVTTIEIKSGYGLDRDTELKMLRAARRIAEEHPIRVRTSFLGAHAVPPEYAENADGYIDDVCIPTLNEAVRHELADAVDGFCEGIAFSPAQIERVFVAAHDLGRSIKLHAEQLSNLGGAALAARYGALSADHLEYLDDAGVAAMADAGTVAVLLPGAYYTLRETQLPPIPALRRQNVAIALATDCNPGSSPLTSLLLTMNMGATLFRLTPEECLTAVTRHAAAALGLTDCGTIATGQRADLAIWDVQHPAELAYRIGFNPLYERIFGGST